MKKINKIIVKIIVFCAIVGFNNLIIDPLPFIETVNATGGEEVIVGSSFMYEYKDLSAPNRTFEINDTSKAEIIQVSKSSMELPGTGYTGYTYKVYISVRSLGSFTLKRYNNIGKVEYSKNYSAVLNYKEDLMSADNLVKKAETSHLSSDLDSAHRLVMKLNESIEKENFIMRIKSIETVYDDYSESSNLTLMSYAGNSSSIEIPKFVYQHQLSSDGFINNFKVSGTIKDGTKGVVYKIAPKAFERKQIESILIPDSVNIIGDSAFYGNNLTDLIIPNSVTEIGSSAFNSNDLSEVVISENITTLSSFVFAYNNFKNIAIPKNVTSIGEYAFVSNELSEVFLPDSLISIDKGVFAYNDIKNIVIPVSLKTLGEEAFFSNPLKSITIPANVEIGINLIKDENDVLKNAYYEYGKGVYNLKQNGDWEINVPVITTETEEKQHTYTNFETKYIEDAKLEKGKEEVRVEGVQGYSITTYTYTYKDGVKINTETDTVIVKPVNKVIAKGTYEEPEVPVKLVKRLGGSNREGTAVLASQEAYADGADSVVLAGFGGDVDALTGTLLAAEKNAPLLITRQYKLSESTKEEILRLGAHTIYILGGENAVNKNVENEIKLMGKNVIRISGANRYATAANVAKTVKDNGADHAFLVLGIAAQKGGALADALAIGPVSANKKSPVLLTQKDRLPKETIEVIKDLGVKQITIVGGISAVSLAVEKQIESLGISIIRVFGSNRANTALAIANKYFIDTDRLLIANGHSSADALVGGYLGNKLNAPILLATNKGLANETNNYINDKTSKVYVLGGKSVVSEKTFNGIKDLLK